MSEEHISQEFRLKNIDETRNQFIEEINQNEYYKFCRENKNLCNNCGNEKEA